MQPLYQKLVVWVGEVVGFPVKIDSTIKSLPNKNLGCDLPQTSLLGNLITHEGAVKCRSRGIANTDDYALMLRRQYFWRPKQIRLKFQRTSTQLNGFALKLLAATTKK